MSDHRPECPKCGSHRVAPIVYGYPPIERVEEAQEDKVCLGGCCVTDRDPNWLCEDCSHRWRHYAGDRKNRQT